MLFSDMTNPPDLNYTLASSKLPSGDETIKRAIGR